jgi:hypothetical protein
VTGISAGSTLTAAFSVFPFGQEAAVVDFVYSIIADLNQTAIFQQWPGGVVEGFLSHSSLFDSTPLRNLFEGLLLPRSLATDRVVCMGATNLRTGLFQRFCDHESVQDVVDATIASAAIPGVFLDQTLTINGERTTFVDGGTVVNVDVIGAVEGCLGLGYAQADIIVDTIECGGGNMTTLSGDLSTLTVLPVLLRAAQARGFSTGQNDYEAAVHAYPNVNFRYRIHPSQTISGTGIDFNRTQMLWMETLGEGDAVNAVKGTMLADL